MYKVIFGQGYTQMVFTFKNYENASEFIKTALFAGDDDVKISISFEPEVKEGEEINEAV